MTEGPNESDSADAREGAVHVVRALRDAGHVAYFAGGCVRDQIMGSEPSDYDVATDAPPDRVTELFPKARLVGQAFGVVMVRSKRAWIEVATFRKDIGIADHRHPEHVEFTDAEHDAQRRDFTINGLFYDPIAEQVIDFVGGRVDVASRTIRAIGVPEQRFAEDYLRMLRAVRFAARFKFSIEENTASAIRQYAPQLAAISRERIHDEVAAMLAHPNRAVAMRLLSELTLDAPALNEPTVDRELALLGMLPGEGDVPMGAALSAWAIDRLLQPATTMPELHGALDRLKGVQITRRWRSALMLSNEDRNLMRGILTTLPIAAHWDEHDIARRKRLMSRDDWPWVAMLLKALAEPVGLDADAFESQTRELAEHGVAPTPLLDGDQLVAAGYPPGPAFKHTLDAVYDAQLRGEIETADEALKLAGELLL